MIILRRMWKDWGFAAALFGQANYFLDLARQKSGSKEQEANTRASIVFLCMSFEAYYFSEVIRGYIQQNRASIVPSHLGLVEDGLNKHKGIKEAVAKWPDLLTGTPLPKPIPHYDNFVRFTKYRNFLLHGTITQDIPGWGRLAQDVETVSNAELALRTITEMMKAVALHFGFNKPDWV